MKKLIVTVLGLSTALWLCAADEDPFKSKKERISYTLGMMYGKSLKQGEVEVDFDVYMKALKDAANGSNQLITDEQAKENFQVFLQEQSTKKAEKMKAEGEKNQKEGEAFLAENKKKEGVVTTASGLQYKIESKGTGKIPASNDIVSCHFRGTLLDGTEFDNTYKQGQPRDMGMARDIKGRIEALLMMPVGSKWKLFVPSELAYGEMGRRGSLPANVPIPPNSMLQFDLELVGIKAPGEATGAVRVPGGPGAPGAPQTITLPAKPK